MFHFQVTRKQSAPRVLAVLAFVGFLASLAGCGDTRLREAARHQPDAAAPARLEAEFAAEKALAGKNLFDPAAPESNTATYKPIQENPYHLAAQTPLSTFSTDVSTASYTNVRGFLTSGKLPPPDAVRIEELINFFTYDLPQPKGEDPIAITTELGLCPWNAKHKLVRIALQAKRFAKDELPPRNFVFLVDTSGSMNQPNRLPLLKKSLTLLVEEMRPGDRVAIVAYAGSAGLVLPSTAGTEKARILNALERLSAGGSTNGGQGIELAYLVASENFLANGVNRVILGTDGDFNVGQTSQGDLLRLIEEKRKTGVYLSILGFGMSNLKDSTMQLLAHHGNGHYAYIDTIEEAQRLFVEQGGALHVLANDVKVQVEFNPARVQAYRLVGYEHRLLRDQDFNDDKKDAGDMGVGHAVTALYVIVPHGVAVDVPKVDPLKYQKPAGKADDNGELLTVKIRYKAPGEEKSRLLTAPVRDEVQPVLQTSPDYRFVTAVAAFGMILRGSKHKDDATLQRVLELAKGGMGRDANGHRAEFIRLVEATERLMPPGRD